MDKRKRITVIFPEDMYKKAKEENQKNRYFNEYVYSFGFTKNYLIAPCNSSNLEICLSINRSISLLAERPL